MKNSKLRRVLMLAVCAVMLVCLSVGATLAYLTDTTAQIINTFSVGKVNFPPDDDDSDLAGGLDEADVDDRGNLYYVDKNDDSKKTTDKDAAKMDNDGEPVPAARERVNTYKLYPDHDYVKDPTIHIDRTSDDCWVFFTINKTDLTFTRTTTTGEGDNATTTTTSMSDIQAGDKVEGSTWEYGRIATQIETNGWQPLKDANNQQVKKDGNMVYYYSTTVNALTDDSCTNAWWDEDNEYIDLVIFEGFSIGANLTQENLPTSDEVNQLKIEIKAYAAQADGFDTALAAWNACFATTSTPGGIGGE